MAFSNHLHDVGERSSRAAALAAERRVAGRLAGIALSISTAVAFATLLVLGRRVPAAFDVVVVSSLCAGLACVLIPWDRLSALWIHAIPLVAIVEIAVGIRLAGVYGDVAANYYLLVAVFAAFAFDSRAVVAAYAALASVAAALPLLYAPGQGSQTVGRTFVTVLSLVVITSIVTVLHEGLHRRQRELEDLAVRDPLTGVGNYRLLSQRLDYEMARHRRTGASLTVMLLDLDGFKEINDTFGHLVGDRVLIQVAHALSAALRSQDTLARQGGDEFSILAPETDDEQAKILSNRARDAVSAATGGSLTTSVGWVTFPTVSTDSVTLLALADADLRRSKRERGTPGRSDEPRRRASILRLVGDAAGVPLP